MRPFPNGKIRLLTGTRGLGKGGGADTAGRVSYGVTGSVQHRRGSGVGRLDSRMGLL